MIVSGVSMILDPAGGTARLLPFRSVREVVTRTVDGTDAGCLVRGLLRAGVALVVLRAAATVPRSRALRLRRRPGAATVDARRGRPV
ncbi:hypothetical protein DQ238_15910 [Geodermatophilus sp. TF02-6]|uniref:hypothetical protein n=1 Tax=Geodermatophilus sp. TF02-6 TaxID=2250575 RepID=UPI000DE9B9B2|nr:hypothetical protein [Geodermatophilus sp. TF02-6]RBY77168.1 hypothetical protein DQ238_15910 [Geodermatophilus sp. TF02-6]